MTNISTKAILFLLPIASGCTEQQSVTNNRLESLRKIYEVNLAKQKWGILFPNMLIFAEV
jgi:hypothetical protein